MDKLKRLKKEDVFIYDITSEEEEKYLQNTMKNIAKREGHLEEKINIAKNLIKANYSINEIIKITELPKE